MAKIDSKTNETTAAAAFVSTAARPPVLGALVQVRVASGARLVNNETGVLFEDGAVTPQVVTVTTLRRLQDGDLVLVG